ncbi:unnamed protein product [Kuraishia capsulata CBS 1993]|uniref:STAS domain-containing protein n=1 Tax=Kuraishia capsulata CBS 1993 TaxID=1382522 RepID=W6ML17_9ASCO|nr:uncharacterized protein KUCA_T00002752001 [Kuraishia capsulata CBS 1993]CDK26778.1 unnamed protein product [Kuraishia capsulata CBS 1993]
MASFNSSLPKAIDKRRKSVSNVIASSFSKAAGQLHDNSFSFDQQGGRGYVIGSFKQNSAFTPLNSAKGTPTVHSGVSIQEKTIDLASVGVPDFDERVSEEEVDEPVGSDIDKSYDFSFDKQSTKSNAKASRLSEMLDDGPSYGGASVPSWEQAGTPKETTPLSSVHDPFRSYTTAAEAEEALTPTASREQYDFESQQTRLSSGIQTLMNLLPKDSNDAFQELVIRPVGYMPAVFLGVLLNILDGLSYGMIMFPISEATFGKLGPVGLSMFYVSCVVSQLVYSLGGSAFKSGIGSEMIEVTPFFHSMALSILTDMRIGDGEVPDNAAAIVSTVVFTYALSSIVTGIVFGLLGKFKLGSLVGFFPRHILVGCIGGVGYFLVVTAIEVSSRLEGGLEYNLPTLRFLLEPLAFMQWVIPLFMAGILVVIQHYNKNALIVPAYFIMMFLLFHAIILVAPQWDLKMAREYGWVFDAPASNEPWYSFYELYDFKAVDWFVVVRQVPTMLALTFFGILHVPINVPALAVTVGMDEFDVDRELLAHGISNTLSGLIGSIQNYLVYTNSVLFIRAGADSRLSGVMLAIGTAAVMMVGPGIIGFIPVCVVGALIYLLGYELLREALFDTYGRLRGFEYLTIIIIVVVMGAWDFVYGILAGILLACVSFVVQAATSPVVSGIFTGAYARSVVVRHPKQQEFLKTVGNQIYIMKLQGSLFFGSIGGLERKIRYRFEDQIFSKEPIRYLILDMHNVLSVDFSAAEGFRRIRNLIIEKECYLIISSVTETGSEMVQALRDSGLWETDEHNKRIQLFTNLNSALEWCENTFLETYRDIKQLHYIPQAKPSMVTALGKDFVSPKTRSSVVGKRSQSTMSLMDDSGVAFGSPRQAQLVSAAKKSLKDETKNASNYYQRRTSAAVGMPLMQPPIPLLLTVLQSVSRVEDSFWVKLVPYLQKEVVASGSKFYNNHQDPPSFFFVESGLISAKYEFVNSGFILTSSVLPLVGFGDLERIITERAVQYTATTEVVVWRLGHAKLEKLRVENVEVFTELLMVALTLLNDRFDAVSSNLLISS